MSDITMCNGKDCPFKESCYRFTATKNEYRQAFFVEPPYNKEQDDCLMYWNNNERINNVKYESKSN